MTWGSPVLHPPPPLTGMQGPKWGLLMNVLDMIIIALMVLLVGLGIFRGFFRELGSLAGLILGLTLANLLQPHLTRLLSSLIPSGKFFALLGFALIFAVVFILCNLLGRGLKKLFGKAFTGWANRILGAGLATLKGLIIIYFGIVLLTFFVPSKAPLIAKSRLAPMIITSYQSMSGIVSPELHHGREEKSSKNQ